MSAPTPTTVEERLTAAMLASSAILPKQEVAQAAVAAAEHALAATKTNKASTKDIDAAKEVVAAARSKDKILNAQAQSISLTLKAALGAKEAQLVAQQAARDARLKEHTKGV